MPSAITAWYGSSVSVGVPTAVAVVAASGVGVGVGRKVGVGILVAGAACSVGGRISMLFSVVSGFNPELQADSSIPAATSKAHSLDVVFLDMLLVFSCFLSAWRR